MSYITIIPDFPHFSMGVKSGEITYPTPAGGVKFGVQGGPEGGASKNP